MDYWPSFAWWFLIVKLFHFLQYRILVESASNCMTRCRPWWLSWMRRLTVDQEVAGSTPAEVSNILSWRLIIKYFLRTLCPRASVKRTYGVYYARRLPPDIQIKLQRRTADFRNFFCLSEIDTRDVQNYKKKTPTFNKLYDVCPAYLSKIHYLCSHWAFKDVHFPLVGVLLTAVSRVAAHFW